MTSTSGVAGPARSARYIGESGFDRFAETNPSGNAGYKPAVEAALYAAYANRLLGENWCEAAFDGGPIVPRADVLTHSQMNDLSENHADLLEIATPEIEKLFLSLA